MDGTPQFPVREHLAEFGLTSAICHGCCHGLRAMRGPDRGKLLRKTWRVATDVPEIRKFLHNDVSRTSPENHNCSRNRLCPHGRSSYRIPPGSSISEDGTHCRVQGQNTKATEGYTEDMVRTIHGAFLQFAKNFYAVPDPVVPLVAAPCLQVHSSAKRHVKAESAKAH